MTGDAGAAPASGLVVAGVSKSFSGRPALQSLDLVCERGQFVTVIGPSGCGKSTLLRVLAGLVEPDAGEVSIFGESVRSAQSEKHIGYVPQSLALLPWRTVLENVSLPLEVNRRHRGGRLGDLRRAPEEILEAFGLGEWLHRRPGELSGGMRQRVAIARAFALEPAVLLMDEPFSAHDELTAELLRHELLELWQAHRTTVVFVTHSVTEAVLLSDLVVVMSRGPGRVRAVVPVDLGRPRNDLVEITDAFYALEREVRLALRTASSAQP